MSFIHLLIAGSFLGLVIAQIVLLWGAEKRFPGPLERLAFLVQTGRRLPPVMLACLAANVLIGGALVTQMKAELASNYFHRGLVPLASKLGAVFVTFLYASGVAMGVGVRLKRLFLAGEVAKDPERYLPYVGKTLRAHVILAIMIVVTIWFGVRLEALYG